MPTVTVEKIPPGEDPASRGLELHHLQDALARGYQELVPPGKLFGLATGDVNVHFPLSREVLVNVRLQAGLVDPTNPGKTWKISLGWTGLF